MVGEDVVTEGFVGLKQNLRDVKRLDVATDVNPFVRCPFRP